jgi:hypothetical protein
LSCRARHRPCRAEHRRWSPPKTSEQINQHKPTRRLLPGWKGAAMVEDAHELRETLGGEREYRGLVRASVPALQVSRLRPQPGLGPGGWPLRVAAARPGACRRDRRGTGCLPRKAGAGRARQHSPKKGLSCAGGGRPATVAADHRAGRTTPQTPTLTQRPGRVAPQEVGLTPVRRPASVRPHTVPREGVLFLVCRSS